jgi:hypothetical protein
MNVNQWLAGTIAAIFVACVPAYTQTAGEYVGAAPVQPVQNEPAAKLSLTNH